MSYERCYLDICRLKCTHLQIRSLIIMFNLSKNRHYKVVPHENVNCDSFFCSLSSTTKASPRRHLSGANCSKEDFAFISFNAFLPCSFHHPISHCFFFFLLSSLPFQQTWSTYVQMNTCVFI